MPFKFKIDKEKLHYRFEKFFTKGGISIFLSLLATFLICFVIIVVLRWFLHLINDDTEDFKTFSDHIWATFLEMTDPGNMNFDTNSPAIIKFSGILSGITGVVIFSALIAFINTALEKTLYEFRKGRSKIQETNHTLILGWNERVLDILRELIMANESKSRASIVILAPRNKEEMDDDIIKHLPASKNTEIVTRSGNPSSLYDINRVNTKMAKSVIILTGCSENATEQAKQHSDINSLKTIMAVIAAQGGKNELPVVVEIFSEEHRDLIRHFNDDKIISTDGWYLMGKLMLQSSLTGGLEWVYNEVLSFEGNEIYFSNIKNAAGKTFSELAGHFEDGIPLGVSGPTGEINLNPDPGTVIQEKDELILLASDDSAVKFSDKKLFTPGTLEPTGKLLIKMPRKILMIGWHKIGAIYVENAYEYMEQGTIFDIIVGEDAQSAIAEIEELKPRAEAKGIEINIIRSEPLSYESLRSIRPFSYKYIIILSQDLTELSGDKTDADTLLVLLLLRKISKEPENEGKKAKILTLVMNSENQDLFIQNDVDDFLTANKLITMILAQMSEQPKLKKVYDSLFRQQGSEIYLKPTKLYFKGVPPPVTFGELMSVAEARGEICMGVRVTELADAPDRNFGIYLNPSKQRVFELGKEDFLVVLAKDEL